MKVLFFLSPAQILEVGIGKADGRTNRNVTMTTHARASPILQNFFARDKVWNCWRGWKGGRSASSWLALSVWCGADLSFPNGQCCAYGARRWLLSELRGERSRDPPYLSIYRGPTHPSADIFPEVSVPDAPPKLASSLHTQLAVSSEVAGNRPSDELVE